MSTAASAALRAAVHDALKNNAALNSLLGGSKVYDEPPRASVSLFTLVNTDQQFFFRRRVRGRASTHSPRMVSTGRSSRSTSDHRHTLAGSGRCAADTCWISPGQFSLCRRRRAPRSGCRTYPLVRLRAVTEPTKRKGFHDCSKRQGSVDQDRRRLWLYRRRSANAPSFVQC